MGIRDILRVPPDFDWPLGTDWQGYVNPYQIECLPCGGLGSTVADKRLDDVVRLLMAGDEEHSEGRISRYMRSPGWFSSGDKVPGPDYADLCDRLSVHPDGNTPRDHGSRDVYSARHKILSAVGLDPDTWGVCPHCSGEGIPHEFFGLYSAWRESSPPNGSAFQAWSFAGSGCPISPVFDVASDLVDWLVTNRVDIGIGRPGTHEEWSRIAARESVMLSFSDRTSVT